MSIEEKVRLFFRRLKASRETCYLLGVSGGADSVVLLRVCTKLFPPEKLGVLYVDHGVRKESAQELAFVRALSERSGIPFFARKLTRQRKRKESVEEWLRRGRYAAAAQVLKQSGFAYFVTAHHSRDLAEAFLMKLCSGGGLQALWPLQEVGQVEGVPVLRPLLRVNKKEIDQYRKRHQLSIMEDPSNENLDYLRNRVRKKLLPFFEELLRKPLEEGIAKSALLAAEDLKFLSEKAAAQEKLLQQRGEGELLLEDAFRQLAIPIQRRLLQTLFRRHLPVSYTFDRGEAVLHLLNKPRKKRLILGECVVERVPEGVLFSFPKTERLSQ